MDLKVRVSSGCLLKISLYLPVFIESVLKWGSCQNESY